MMRGAGARRVLDGTVTGGAPRAQVGTALTTLLMHLSFDKCIFGDLPDLLYGLFQNKVQSETACKLMISNFLAAGKYNFFPMHPA